MMLVGHKIFDQIYYYFLLWNFLIPLRLPFCLLIFQVRRVLVNFNGALVRKLTSPQHYYYKSFAISRMLTSCFHFFLNWIKLGA